MPVRYASRAPRRRAPPPEEDPALEEPLAPPGPPHGDAPPNLPPSRSHAAAIVALVLLLLGAYLASWTVLAPGLLALILLSSGWAFLGTRLNPLSVGFYLTTKPSWTAIATVYLVAFVLLAIAYSYWKNGWGPVFPHHLVPWS